MLPTPLKLLMVEDSSMDAELTLLRLERSGLHVESQLVFDHIGVEHALREAHYDLILCDCVLPGSSGTDVLAIAQRLAPDTPFIFLSGIYGEEHAVEMIRLGADARTDGHHAVVRGIPQLSSAPVWSSDIRAGAGLVLAGLVADGETEVHDVFHIDRGYPLFVENLVSLGAEIERVN